MILAVWRLERRETLATNKTNITITPAFNLQRDNTKILTLSDQTNERGEFIIIGL